MKLSKTIMEINDLRELILNIKELSITAHGDATKPVKISANIVKINDLRRSVPAFSFEPARSANPKRPATHRVVGRDSVEP
ncbi:MAG TPA: hypothetical protein VGR14_08540 [Verrucomicrobiae bacterium]|nr:hypothetical protein [Verrucomicrobiae bacterium]